jgi:hypothetical protein
VNELRCRRLVAEAIRRIELDLTGLTVLTEAATGSYALTPLIAALAGAPRVLALTADNRHASAAEARAMVEGLAARWGVGDSVELIDARDDPRLRDADVVTNLGAVRPLDAAFLSRLGPTAAISLMWETWEFRPEDLDLDECRRRGIPVLGTNEADPLLRTADFVGMIAVKLVLDLDVEVVHASVAVLGGGVLADAVEEALRRSGADVVRLEPDADGSVGSDAASRVAGLDALVVVEHHVRAPVLGQGASLTAEQLLEASSGVAVAHICGGANRDELVRAGIPVVPSRFAPAGSMSLTTDAVGPRPLIDLHAAGLAVGAALARARLGGADGYDAEVQALAACRFAQGFAGHHDVRAQA